MKTRISYMTRWLTSYFAHGDLSTRDLDAVEYVLPSTSRIPTLWNMSSQEIADIVDEGPHLVADAPLLLNCYPQAAATYKKGTYSAAARALLPKMKIWELMGDATTAVSLCTFWILQDDDAAHGGGFINFKVIPGHNHFVRSFCSTLCRICSPALTSSCAHFLGHVGRPQGDSPSVSRDVGVASHWQAGPAQLKLAIPSCQSLPPNRIGSFHLKYILDGNQFVHPNDCVL